MTAAIRPRASRSYAGVVCPRCKGPLPAALNATGLHRCVVCGGEFGAVRFTPPEIRTRVQQVAEGGPEGTTACAHHGRNAAVATCERCGHFICALCKIETDGRTLCPACFDRLSAEGALQSTLTSFPDYPGRAIGFAVLGLLMFIVAFAAGPAAIYYSVKGSRLKRSMGETDGRIQLGIALVLGVLETIGGWLLVGFFIYGIVKA